ncbi:winged helix-turn-helix transcriptional regulator (plasmid) [Paroceanicella profunda]|uniref:Winged helix-turn-helix transcriptional regulator n=1 Tax=Paroceanicella profunda TaxID=2579971 RepID=A0A5B8G4J1_9RHOB|nr:MarR family winged helix-turn-helix transcriptional regulator [Paroceanicella profunda]QDL94960.1 winged helix-turn-helix transcriptional regulator [Paroceanicella profunda]
MTRDTPAPAEPDIHRISRALGRLRVLTGRRVISRVAIANVAPGAELSFIDVLTLVPGCDPGATASPDSAAAPVAAPFDGATPPAAGGGGAAVSAEGAGIAPGGAGLSAPAGPEAATDCPGTTVGAVARAMRIDPSRASRLISEMVARGLLARVASPSDARSSLVVRTELGERLHAEMRSVKHRLIGEALDGWPPEMVASFAEQFECFIDLWGARIDAIGDG